MHEMSIAEGVIQVLEEQAVLQSFRRVKRVRLEIGPLAAVEADSLRFCFDAVSRGTLAEQSSLEIIDLPGTAWCLNCHATVSIRRRYDSCTHCGSYQLQVTGGDELRIKDLEVE
jgi:hydrogenase nickel incorporation protein HypA/HybF